MEFDPNDTTGEIRHHEIEKEVDRIITASDIAIFALYSKIIEASHE